RPEAVDRLRIRLDQHQPAEGPASRPTAVRLEAHRAPERAAATARLDRRADPRDARSRAVRHRARDREPESTQARRETMTAIATREAPTYTSPPTSAERAPASLDAQQISAWFGKRKVLERCSLTMPA